jgi:putative DNA primase/helicase
MYDCIKQNEELQPENIPKNEFTEVQLLQERALELESSFAAKSLPVGFSFDEGGWLIYQDTSSEDGVPIKICSRLDIAARTRDQAYENHGRLLEFADPDGTVHRWSMPMELLAGDGTSYREELLSKGLLIAPGQKSRMFLTMYIQGASPRKTIWCVLQTGWNRERTAFVFHNETIRRCGSEELILQTASSLSVVQHVAGTLEEWQQLSKLCIGNSMLIFAMSLAFAPPLLHLLQMESGGVHFRGKSSTGKSTCLFAATSVWGGPEYVQQWRATANGLEGTAANHNDSLLCLDEIGQMDPQEVGKTAYMLANGVGKARADRLGNSKKPKAWRLLFLSSGEISLSDHMREANQKARAGKRFGFLIFQSMAWSMVVLRIFMDARTVKYSLRKYWSCQRNIMELLGESL